MKEYLQIKVIQSYGKKIVFTSFSEISDEKNFVDYEMEYCVCPYLYVTGCCDGDVRSRKSVSKLKKCNC